MYVCSNTCHHCRCIFHTYIVDIHIVFIFRGDIIFVYRVLFISCISVYVGVKVFLNIWKTKKKLLLTPKHSPFEKAKNPGSFNKRSLWIPGADTKKTSYFPLYWLVNRDPCNDFIIIPIQLGRISSPITP